MGGEADALQTVASEEVPGAVQEDFNIAIGGFRNRIDQTKTDDKVPVEQQMEQHASLGHGDGGSADGDAAKRSDGWAINHSWR
jgi:hypothetical protein